MTQLVSREFFYGRHVGQECSLGVCEAFPWISMDQSMMQDAGRRAFELPNFLHIQLEMVGALTTGRHGLR
jgi:hypothetical protein